MILFSCSNVLVTEVAKLYGSAVWKIMHFSASGHRPLFMFQPLPSLGLVPVFTTLERLNIKLEKTLQKVFPELGELSLDLKANVLWLANKLHLFWILEERFSRLKK